MNASVFDFIGTACYYVKEFYGVQNLGHIVDYNLTEELAHGTYVACLSRDLAREMGFDSSFQKEMARAGLVHDIGKLKLANYIYGEEKLQSPLVIEEMKYVRMHPMLSYEILRDRGYDSFICESVKCHHENWDGTGYPDNISGEQIPIGARIIRTCDVFAALTQDRPYRRHLEMEEAIALMIDEINHFDMQVFLAFERVVHQVGTKYKVEFPDSDDILLKRI